MPELPQRVILVPLFKDMPVTTNGVGASATLFDIEVARVRNLLPYAASLALYGLVTEAAAADFEFNVAFISGFNRNHEAAAVNVSTAWIDSTPTGGLRTADNTTLANFLPETRIQAEWRNKAEVSGVKTARISAILIVTLL